MKQVLFIGDVHGRSEWIKYVDQAINEGMDVVFLGDYVDSFDVKPQEIEQNLLRIISIKKKYDARKTCPYKVTLLLGNHDYAYIIGKSATSGYQAIWAERYREIFNQNWGLFDLAWGYKSYSGEYTLATHAGLTQSLWDNEIIGNPEVSEFVHQIYGDRAFADRPIHEILMILKDKFQFIWKVGQLRGGDDTPGIIWADLNELKEDPYKGINQVIGHTGWHTTELLRIDNNFIAKVDGTGGIQRLIINL